MAHSPLTTLLMLPKQNLHGMESEPEEARARAGIVVITTATPYAINSGRVPEYETFEPVAGE